MTTNKEKQHMKEVLEELIKELKEEITRKCIYDWNICKVETEKLLKEIDKLTKETISKHCGKPLEDD